MSKARRIGSVGVFFLVLLGLPGPPAPAEVGAVVYAGGMTAGYIEVGIIEDPEPIGNAWVRHHPQGGIRFALNEEGAANGDGDPALITDLAGYPLAAWSRHTPAGYDIVVSRFDGVQWSTPETVSGLPADELDPQLIRDPGDGSIHLLYWINDGAPRVMHRQAPSDLASWSSATQLSDFGHIACRPSGAFHQGSLFVAYELHGAALGSTPRQIVLTTANGQAPSFQILATTYQAGQNWPRVHAAGSLLWLDWIDTSCDMAWRKQVVPLSWEPVDSQHFDSSEQRDFHTRGLIRQLVLQ